MKPLVSIIIPTYNRAHIIGETLDSIIEQTYKNWECIIVDDGSTDQTESLISSYQQKDSRFRFYKRPLNKLKGPNSCRNIGFEKSVGDFIQWFDSDDLYKPDTLQNYMSAFKETTDGVVAPLERVVLATGEYLGNNLTQSMTPIMDYLIGNITYYVSGPIWRKTFLKQQTQLFDERISNMDDWDFNLRMLYAKPVLFILDTAFIIYRVHPDSLHKELNKANIAEIRSDLFAREKHLFILKQLGFEKERGILNSFILKRKLRFLRKALIADSVFKNQLFKEALIAHMYKYHFRKAFKITLGFISYKLFKKGFQWLK